MAEGEVSNPDVPKGPDTLGDPTLIEADETLTRIAEAEGRQQDRMENHNLIFKMVEASLTKVTDKIAEEQKKSSPDYGRLTELSARQKSLTEKRDEMKGRADKKADEKEKAVASDMTASAKELEGDLVKMKELQDKKTALEAQLTSALLASTVPAEIAKKEAVYSQLKELDKALKKYEKRGGYKDQEDTAEGRKAMSRKAMAMTEAADHEAEMAVVEAELQAYINGTDAPKGEESKPDEAAAKKGEAPLTAEQKELILDNKIDQIALDLARLLASDVPKDTDTFGQYSFQAKRALLIVLSYCGGDPAWANNLNKDEQKALGMTVSSKADSDGKTLTTIKWDKIDFSLNKVQNVYEVAFGKEGWTKEMGELTPTTKLEDLQDKVAAFPADTTDPRQQQMIKFVDALVKSGATPKSGVQEFVIKNSKQIIAIYKPETATPAAGTEATESGEKLVDPVGIIKAKGLKNDTPLGELLKAIDPAYSIPPDLTIETAPLKAAEIMETLTSAEAIAAYQAKIEMNSHSLVLLGLPDTTEALQPIFTTASSEMQSNNHQLSDDTKKALETGIGEQMIATKALADKPCKEILEKMKDSIDEPNSIKQIEAILAALEENSKAPAAPDAPAPEASTK